MNIKDKMHLRLMFIKHIYHKAVKVNTSFTGKLTEMILFLNEIIPK